MNVNSLSTASRRFLIKVAKGHRGENGGEHATARALAKCHYITGTERHGYLSAPWEITVTGWVAINFEVNRFDRAHQQATERARSIVFTYLQTQAEDYPEFYCDLPHKPSSWEPDFERAETDLVDRIVRAILDERFADMKEIFDDRFPARCEDLRAALAASRPKKARRK